MNIISIILFSKVDWYHFKHRIYKYTNYFFMFGGTLICKFFK